MIKPSLQPYFELEWIWFKIQVPMQTLSSHNRRRPKYTKLPFIKNSQIFNLYVAILNLKKYFSFVLGSDFLFKTILAYCGKKMLWTLEAFSYLCINKNIF